MIEMRRCKRCIMTEKGDPNIRFDEHGYCNYCSEALNKAAYTYFPNEEGKKKIDEMCTYLKEKNADKKYDCLMGISGGLDSCYLAYLGAAKWGLRIAAIHIDDGFDTEISKRNIEKLCEKCNIQLRIIQPDAEQFNELTRAYMLAGVPNLAVPQDNILFANIYKFAVENEIMDFLCGDNYALECILQGGNTHNPRDLVNIKDINNRFGRKKIDKLDFISDKKYKELLSKGFVKYSPLNFIDYNRDNALKELADFCEFEYYGSKHLENYLTGFLQLQWLPYKFDVDKRTSHLSSMIISGQLSREEALKELEKKACSDEWMNRAIELIKEKIDFSDEEYEKLMKDATHKHTDYKYNYFPYWKSKIYRKLIIDKGFKK